jgi:hypothetical protein
LRTSSGNVTFSAFVRVFRLLLVLKTEVNLVLAHHPGAQKAVLHGASPGHE